MTVKFNTGRQVQAMLIMRRSCIVVVNETHVQLENFTFGHGVMLDVDREVSRMSMQGLLGNPKDFVDVDRGSAAVDGGVVLNFRERGGRKMKLSTLISKLENWPQDADVEVGQIDTGQRGTVRGQNLHCQAELVGRRSTADTRFV